ncbi:hypothetical protein, partial [uncultured Sphingomonas sp.]|uniref:hypothetical protein n=1 Tax=uncultured Sphingomonas sp. TaxID=158754 RepID=UPI0025ED005C
PGITSLLRASKPNDACTRGHKAECCIIGLAGQDEPAATATSRWLKDVDGNPTTAGSYSPRTKPNIW